MDKVNKILESLTAISDFRTQLFILALGVLVVIGMALYVILQAVKRGGGRP